MPARHDLDPKSPKPDAFLGDRDPELEVRMSAMNRISLAGAIPADRVRATIPPIRWRRLGKLILGAALIAVGVVVFYQQLIVRVSRVAVINARVSVIRAPIDGMATRTITVPGTAVRAGSTIGQVEDPQADNARFFQLEQELGTIERERHTLSGRLADLQRAETEADRQAEAFRLGRLRQTELRIEEARANLAGAVALEAGATSAASRGAILHAQGFQSDAVEEGLRHTQEIDRQGVVAARKRIETLVVELDAARKGTYLGDNYNDVPSSYQRARDLALRIDETRQTLDQTVRHSEALETQLAAERQRLATRSKVDLVAPVDGPLWSVLAASGEYVRKGQDLFTVLDCSTVVVTASVTERDYNELRLRDQVRFRVSGTAREYSGGIVNLGTTSAGILAISADAGGRQIVVSVPGLAADREDQCAVGRTGEVIFGDTRGVGARLGERLRGWFSLS
jgi:multidrug resistance efflux pump